MYLLIDDCSIDLMKQAGALLSDCFHAVLPSILQPGVTTQSIDDILARELHSRGLVSQSKGYRGYRHVSCISINDVVVHGVPRNDVLLKMGDLVKVDVCAAYQGYCADMARCYFIGADAMYPAERALLLVKTATDALHAGVSQAVPGNRIGDISFAIQKNIEKNHFGIVRDFAGHGIGRKMHEAPEILNYGTAGRGPKIVVGMALAIEPMITIGSPAISIDRDGWTARTADGSLAAHVEDTVLVTADGPFVTTRFEN